MVRKLALTSLSVLVAVCASNAAWAGEIAPKVPAEVNPPRPVGDYFVERLAELKEELSRTLPTPRAAATLYRLDALASDLPSLDSLADLFRQTAVDHHASGEVRSLARYFLAEMEVSQGHLTAAREDLNTLGFATEGWLLGGFDNEGGAGHDTVYAPEKEAIDLKATYPGKERDIAWHRVPAIGPNAALPVADLI